MKIPRCHPDKKHHAKGFCRQCHTAYRGKFYRERLRELDKKSREKNRERRSESQKAYAKKNADM